jgi:hypothetical protein
VLSVLALAAQVAWLGLSADSTRAASVTVNLDQWASLDIAWQNGNLNGNNSRYPEGGVVPFRLAIEGLSVGNHEITISYDFTAGGHKAYDFLTTWNATNATGTICQPSGGAISSMCPSMPSPSSMTLPFDLFIVDGMSVAAAQVYAGMSRRLTIWGGSILAIGAPIHSGSASGNSEVEFVVRFRATGSAVLLAWGGHLAQSSYWNALAGGEPDGASLVSGAPWHVRTLGLDGGGGKNQDRSIQPSAIVGALPPLGSAPTPPPGAPSRTSPPRPPGVAGPVPTPPNTALDSLSTGPGPDPARLSALLVLWALCLAAAAGTISQRRRR